ncbi:MAG: hypothetical protein LV481_10740 [Methylacidiphilales bacterium]|nr:hypothetical protein [Candidatus Methylacidiphilales bacterium]
MIDFSRALSLAWERMVIILFSPFDLGKWFAIGLSAFLAGFLSGGNGINSSYNYNNKFNSFSGGAQSPSASIHQLYSSLSGAMAGVQLAIIIIVGFVVLLFVLALIVVIYWLGARGQFLFLDNIVRNRGAIAWPWSYYSRQANSLFLFYLLLIVVSLLIFLPIIGVAIMMGIPLYIHQRWPEGWEIVGFIVLGLAYMVIATVFSFILFVFKEFGVPLMFRNGLLAQTAFMESLSIIRLHFGSVFVYVLLRIALWLAIVILSIITCCFTCCIAMLPYIGTVVLLPALVFVRCFSLDCLAQFGPQYDVWTVDVPPEPTPGAASS